jgi:hypothetical protein
MSAKIRPEHYLPNGNQRAHSGHMPHSGPRRATRRTSPRACAGCTFRPPGRQDPCRRHRGSTALAWPEACLRGRACPGQAQLRDEPEVSRPSQRRDQVRTRLAAGGRWIRTPGPGSKGRRLRRRQRGRALLNVPYAAGTGSSNLLCSSEESRANRVDRAHDRSARATRWYAQSGY